jgi:hypothetical protein
MGGVIIGHEMGRALGVEAMFVERPTGTFELRRGFTLKGDKVLMVEDVVTTGLSSREAIKAIEGRGEVIAAAALVDRSAGAVDLGVPFFPLIELNFPTYAPDELPPELAATRRSSRAAGAALMAGAAANAALTPGRLRLGVNIDHVATIRNARGGDHPDPVRAAEIVAAVGGDGITAHCARTGATSATRTSPASRPPPTCR